MNILVCIKQILDPDLPARDFKIDEGSREAARGAANLVINIFCENALESALQLRDATEGKVTALCYGTEEAEDALRKALAMTVDEAALVVRQGSSNPDAATVARVLAAAIKKLGEFDLILVGRESGDWGGGQTGGLLAEELGLPMLGFVDEITVTDDGEVRLKRQTDSGFEIAQGRPPCLATVTNQEGNVPRIPKTRDVMMSYRKPMTTFTLADLGLDTDEIKAATRCYEVAELFVPSKDVECTFAKGDSLEEQVDDFSQQLARVLASV